MIRKGVFAAAAIGVAVLAAGCNSSTGTENQAAFLELVGGNGQAGFAGQPLELPLRVRVTDVSGDPVSGLAVRWTVVDGGGNVTSQSISDQEGLAAAEWTLGGDITEQHVTAEVRGLNIDPVTFTATAEEQPGDGGGGGGGGNL